MPAGRIRLANRFNGALANDDDPDGDALTVAAVGGAAGAVGVWTPGDNGGAFKIFANGAVDFRDLAGDFDALAPGETRTTAITYTAADPDGAQDTATVRFAVTEDGLLL